MVILMQVHKSPEMIQVQLTHTVAAECVLGVVDQTSRQRTAYSQHSELGQRVLLVAFCVRFERSCPLSIVGAAMYKGHTRLQVPITTGCRLYINRHR